METPYLVYTITGRRQFFWVGGVKQFRLLTPRQATEHLEAGLEMVYR